MSALNEYITLELAENDEKTTPVYQCEVSTDSTKITAGPLPLLEIRSKVDDFVDVIISYVDSPAKFYVQMQENDVVALKQKLSLLYANPSIQKRLNHPRPGQCCAIKHRDHLWYRATVINHSSPTQVEVYLTDFGNRVKVPAASVNVLHPECTFLPPQAIECKLENVNVDAGVELTQKFRDVTDCQDMVVRIVGQDSTALVVTLFKVIANKDYNINNYLLGNASPPPRSTAPWKILATDPPAVVATPRYQDSGNDSGWNRGGGPTGFGRSTVRGGGRGSDHANVGSSSFPGGGRGSDHANVGRSSFPGGGRGSDHASFGSNSFRGGGRGGDQANVGHSDRRGCGRGNGQCGDQGSVGRGDIRSCNSDGGMKTFEPIRPQTSSVCSAASVCTPAKMGFPRRSLKEGDIINGNIIQIKSPSDFWITFARESDFAKQYMPDSMWAHSKQYVPLKDPQIGRCCIMLDKPGSGFPIYCRSVITAMNEKTCDLVLVDYGESRKSQSIDELYEVPVEFSTLECQAIQCKLAGVAELWTQFDDELKRNIFSNMVNHCEVTATVKGFDKDITIVHVRFGQDKTDLMEVCKNIGRGNSM